MNLFLLYWLLATGYWHACRWRIKLRKATTRYVRQPNPIDPILQASRTRKKPDWVKHEVLCLKAHMGKAGCRKVAMTFNRLHGRQADVSKPYVADIIKHNQYQLACLIRET